MILWSNFDFRAESVLTLISATKYRKPNRGDNKKGAADPVLAASAADPMLAAGALTLSSHATAVVAKAAQPLQSALLLRGGRLSRPEYLHSVLLMDNLNFLVDV